MVSLEREENLRHVQKKHQSKSSKQKKVNGRGAYVPSPAFSSLIKQLRTKQATFLETSTAALQHVNFETA